MNSSEEYISSIELAEALDVTPATARSWMYRSGSTLPHVREQEDHRCPVCRQVVRNVVSDKKALLTFVISAGLRTEEQVAAAFPGWPGDDDA